MASNKITWDDKVGLTDYEVRVNQVQDRDMNEVKSVVNSHADNIDVHTTEIEDLTAAQTGGLKSFTTLALLQAYPTPNVNDSYKVTNDTTTSNNGYYHWVSGTNYVKDADLVVSVLNATNTSDGVSGKAVADYSATLRGGLVASGETKDVSGDVVEFSLRNKADVEITSKNLFNFDTVLVGYRVNFDGSIKVEPTMSVSDFIKVEPNTDYYSTRYQFLGFYDINRNPLSVSQGLFYGFTTPENCEYIRISDNTTKINSIYQVELGTVETSFVKYNESLVQKLIPNNDLITINTITVARYGTADYVGRRAIQDAIDSIDDANYRNRYEILVANGTYEAFNTGHFDKTNPGFCFIQGKNYVSVIGQDKDRTIIDGSLADNLGVSFPYSSYQPIYWHSNYGTLENITVIGKNIRYPIHIDGGAQGLKDYIQNIKNVRIQHQGNFGDATNWSSHTPLGLGTSDGQKLTIEDAEFETSKTAMYTHNNADFTKASIYHLKRCRINTENEGGAFVINIQNFGSGVNDEIILEDCVIGEGSIGYDATHNISENLESQKANLAEIKLIAPDLLPRPFYNNTITPVALKIISKSTGGSSSVTIDSTSTAFDYIIGNSFNTYTFTNRFGRVERVGYEYKVGGNSLNGYAFGSLDISETGVGTAANKYIKSLGKRLGDCSTVNKILTVNIDGTNYNIVFDKDYDGTDINTPSTYDNATIIAEILAVIGGVADVEEYAPTKEYYPTFKGNELKINTDTSEILSGMGVVFTSAGKMRKALNSDNKIDGICIDDCRVNDKGRVITGIGAQIYTQNVSQSTFTLKETSTGTRLAGTNFGISATPGVFEVDATPTLLTCKFSTVAEIIKL